MPALARARGEARERQAGVVGSTLVKPPELRLFRVIVPVGDIERANRLAGIVSGLALFASCALSLSKGRRR